MSSESVTYWLQQLSRGNQDAAGQLWKRYASALLRIARRFGRNGSHVENEEDLVQSVFLVLWKGAERGDWNELKSREELWWLLLTIARRKAIEHHRYWSAQKRGGDENAQPLGVVATSDSTAGFVDLPDTRTLPPDAAAIAREEHDRLMAALGNETLRGVAAMRLEGQTNDAIAAALGVATRTVVRKLNLIKAIWSREIEV